MVSTDYLAVLTRVAMAPKNGLTLPKSEEVINALLEAEKVSKQKKLSYEFESIAGQWRLCFATGTKKAGKKAGITLGKGFYIPKLTFVGISFNIIDKVNGRGEIGNQVKIGSLSLQLQGPAKWQNKKNLLAFDFNKALVKILGASIYSGGIRGGKSKSEDFYHQSIAKQAFFAFFIVTDDFIAARGKGGGLALWKKENFQ
jgi:hypothetical protein